MEINQEIKVEVIDVNYLGQGISKYEGNVIFIPGALKNEVVLVRITKMTKKFITAKIITIIKASEHRVQPKCKYIKNCGGCDFMHTSNSLEYKKDFVKQTIQKQLHKKVIVNDVLSSADQFHYRNKVIFSLKSKNGQLTYGFFKKGTHNLISIDECINVKKDITKIINDSIHFFNKSTIDLDLIRHIMIRSTSTGESMVVIVVRNKVNLDSYITYITEKNNKIKSIYENLNNKITNLPFGPKYRLIFGNQTITEVVNGLKFNVSPQSFLQINTKASEILYNEAIRRLNDTNKENIIDAYSGIGTISLMLASKANQVFGIEIVPEAVKNAKINMELNGINNVTFINGPAEVKVLDVIMKNKIDSLVVDPPRKGCDKDFLNAVIKSDIKKIIYISCKTSSLGRDAKYLEDNGYLIEDITPVDLFSNTTNIECVTSFIKK